MGNYLKGNPPSAIYTQFLSVGGANDHVGLTASLKDVWTDDGDSSIKLAPFQLSINAIRVTGAASLEFRDDAQFIKSAGASTLTIQSATLNLNAAALLNIDGDTDITGTLAVSGATTLSGSLAADAGITVDTNKFTVDDGTGNTTIAGTLGVTGATTLAGALTATSGTFNGALDVNSTGDFSGALTCSKATGYGLAVASDAEIGGDLTVDGDLDLTGALVVDSTSLFSDAVTISAQKKLQFGDANTYIWRNASGYLNLTSNGVIELNSAGVDINTTGGCVIDSGLAISLDAAAASNFTTSSGDLTLEAAAGSVNITANENSTNAIYLHANGGTSETIKIHSDQGTATNSIELTSDAGGIDINASTGVTIDVGTTLSLDSADATNLTMAANDGNNKTLTISASNAGAGDGNINIDADGTIDITSGVAMDITTGGDLTFDSGGATEFHCQGLMDIDSKADKQIDIGGTHADTINIGEVENALITIGHTTSETIIGDNLTVNGNLSVDGTVSYDDLTLESTAPILTLRNTLPSNNPNSRESIIDFRGGQPGEPVGTWSTLARIRAEHEGAGDDEKGTLRFYVNDGNDSDSPEQKMAIFSDGSVDIGIDNTLSGNECTAIGYLNNLSGDYSFSVGRQNTISAMYGSTVGFRNTVSGSYGTSRGYRAKSSNYGQHSTASGYFEHAGDAQSSTLMLRREVGHSTTNWYSLYLDGASNALVVPNDTVWLYKALVVGTSLGTDDDASFEIVGSIKNDDGTVSVLAHKAVDTIHNSEDFDCQATIVGNTLVIQVKEDTVDEPFKTMRWVCNLSVTEVRYDSFEGV